MVQTVIVVHLQLSAALLYNRDHSKYAHVGCQIHQYVVHQCGHAVGTAANNSQHDVTCLRDGREGHEAFQVLLTNGKEVGNGDGGNDHPVKYFLPLCYNGSKYFDENSHQHECSRSFGNNAEVAGYGCRCSFVYICCPQVEGN